MCAHCRRSTWYLRGSHPYRCICPCLVFRPHLNPSFPHFRHLYDYFRQQGRFILSLWQSPSPLASLSHRSSPWLYPCQLACGKAMSSRAGRGLQAHLSIGPQSCAHRTSFRFHTSPRSIQLQQDPESSWSDSQFYRDRIPSLGISGNGHTSELLWSEPTNTIG